MVEAWNSRDLEAIRALHTDDIVHHDATYSNHLIGIEAVMEMTRDFTNEFPSIKRKITKRLMGLEDNLAVFDYWGFRLNDCEFTQADLALIVFLLKTRGDRISTWTLFYGLETMEKIGFSSFDEARSLLSSYGSAWSSGDPSIIGNLYAGNAVREATMLGELQEGSKTISCNAESFFARYPGAQWTLLQAFGEGHGWQGEPPIIGGSFAIRVTDPTGQPCEALAAVLLQASGGQIIHEALYYEPDSLTRCGWMR
jgi:hypothetical protein